MLYNLDDLESYNSVVRNLNFFDVCVCVRNLNFYEVCVCVCTCVCVERERGKAMQGREKTNCFG